MINIFGYAPNDQSLVYLIQLFGSMNGIIPTPSGAPVGGSISLLGTMFKTFNTTLLIIGALVVVYTTVVGVIMTAHEGEFMGKKWNNIWIPIRIVLGIAALVPTGSGYSTLQIILMWIIVQGVGAADTLWNSVLNYVNVIGSPYGQVSLPTAGVNQTLTGLFQGLVCDANARIAADNPYSPGSEQGGYYCKFNSSNGFCGSSPAAFNPSTTSYSLGPNGSCGTLSFCNQQSACSGGNSGSSQINCVACNAQIDALTNIIPTLTTIANQFAQADYAYQSFYDKTASPFAVFSGQKVTPPDFVQAYCSANNINPCSGLLLPRPGQGAQNLTDDAVNNVIWPYVMQPLAQGNFMATAVNYYMNDVSGQVNNYIVQQQNNNSNLPETLRNAQQTGWILAGGYYYTISQMNANNLQNAIPPLSILAIDPQTSTDNTMYGYRSDYQAANTLIAAASGAGNSAFSSGGSQFAPISTNLNAGIGGIGQVMTTNISNQTGYNPNALAKLVVAGQALIISAEVLFGVVTALTITIAIVGNISIFVLGNAVTNPVGWTLNTLYALFVPMFFALVGTLIGLGGALAIYTPLIPYTIFTFGAIAWFISAIEAMVAAPLVALGILSPAGQHELLGKSEPALMHIFYVFLRPSLMIFGLMAAMLLAVIVVNLINAAFWTVAQSIMNTSITPGSIGVYGDPLEMILFLAAYVFLIISSLNKVFALIGILPERILRWISTHGVGHGEETAGEALGAMKAGIGATAGAAAGTMGAAASKLKGLAEKYGKGEGGGGATLGGERGVGEEGNKTPIGGHRAPKGGGGESAGETKAEGEAKAAPKGWTKGVVPKKRL